MATQYTNPCFKVEFGDYLLAVNYKISSTSLSLAFYNGDKMIHVRNDSIDVFDINPTPLLPAVEKFIHINSFTGISRLNIFDFIMLMHAVKVQDVNTAVEEAAKQNAQLGTEMKTLVKNISSLTKAAA